MWIKKFHLLVPEKKTGEISLKVLYLFGTIEKNVFHMNQNILFI